MKHKIGRLFLFFTIIILLSGCATMSPLSKASSAGNIAAMRALIKQGVDVNEPAEKSYKASALHWAANAGKSDAVATLIEAGANVNSGDYCGQTPIFYAINSNSKNRVQVVNILIDKGADLSIRDCNKYISFEYAKYNQDKEVTELIISKNPKLAGIIKNLPFSIASCKFETEAGKAVKYGFISSIKKLIEAKADLDEADCYGYRAIDYARDNKNEEMVQLLLSVTPKSAKGDTYSIAGNVINYHNAAPNINYQSGKKLAIAVCDRREYVISTKEKSPAYAGYIYSNMSPSYMLPPIISVIQAIPIKIEISTVDKKPVVQILSQIVEEGFKKSGFEVVRSVYNHDQIPDSSLETVKQSKPERIIILKLDEWVIEPEGGLAKKAEFKYSVHLSILDEQGKELLTNTFAGREIIDGPGTRSQVVAPDIAFYLLTDILNRLEVVAALK